MELMFQSYQTQKKMKNDALIGLILILFFSILGATYLCRNEIRQYFSTTLKGDTIVNVDTIYKIDSIEIIKPIPKYITKIKVDTVYDKNDKPIELITENKQYQDTILCAEDTVTVTSYTSGINANLDSLKVKLSKREVIKETVITKYIEKPKTFGDHFKIRPAITVGYDVFNKQFGMMGGVSLVYDF